MSFREPKQPSIEARAGSEESLTMKIRPLHDRLVVTRVAEETKTSGGLFIPDSAKEKPARGVVVSVGQGKRDDAGKRIALDVKAGDEVLFGKYAGTELKLDGEEHIVLREDEILAIIEK
jgi:chaperonin GroES